MSADGLSALSAGPESAEPSLTPPTSEESGQSAQHTVSYCSIILSIILQFSTSTTNSVH